MTNTELKNNIDTAITNKTSVSSITPVNVGEQIKSTVDYIDQEISNIELIPGPQGAQGPQGVQGPIGPSGTAPTSTQGLVTASSSFPYPVLTNSLNQVLATADNNSRVVLPTSTAIVGQKVVVSCIGGYKLLVKAAQAGGGIYTDGLNNDLVNEFYIYPNETYEFTYNDNAEWISYFEEPKAKYKSYVIKVITGAPLTTYVLENTLDAVVAVSIDSSSIVLTCSLPIFLYPKTHIISSSYNSHGSSFITYPTIVSDTEVRINSFKANGSDAMDSEAEVYIELKVYN